MSTVSMQYVICLIAVAPYIASGVLIGILIAVIRKGKKH